jgi:prophage antirepressor-like protein
LKTEKWLGHEIRFVEKDPGEWWAVLKDVTDAMGLRAKKVSERLDDEVLSKGHVPDSLGRNQEMLIVNEYGIYETVFESRKKEAKEFKKWVFSVIKQLRQTSGLAGFEVFRLLDKEEQRAQMAKLNQSLRHPVQVNFIKANTIANKAVSTRHGYPKMVKKKDMPPEMLADRQPILQDVVDLMAANDRFDLGVHVSDAIYKKYAGGDGS